MRDEASCTRGKCEAVSKRNIERNDVIETITTNMIKKMVLTIIFMTGIPLLA
jgi:hypothetical protein